MANELLRVRGRHPRPRAEPRRARDRCRRPRRVQRHRGGPAGPAHRRGPLGAGRRRLPRPRRRPARQPDRRPRARSRPRRRRALELQAPSVVQRQVGARAAADRHQGHRRHDADRPRPASADHRRPADRQDRGRASTRSSTSATTGSPATRRKQVRCIYVAIGQKGSTIAAVRGALEEAGALEYTTIVAAPGVRPGRLQVPRAVHRLGHRPALDVRGQARPDHLRRPVEAGRRLPRRVAAAAPPAGPRGLPG